MAEYPARMAEYLAQVRALVDTPEKWTQWAAHRTLEDGSECFCVLGALWEPATVARGPFTPDHALAAEALLTELIMRRNERILGPESGWLVPARWNDHPSRRHEQVLELMDDAISGVSSLEKRHEPA